MSFIQRHYTVYHCFWECGEIEAGSGGQCAGKSVCWGGTLLSPLLCLLGLWSFWITQRLSSLQFIDAGKEGYSVGGWVSGWEAMPPLPNCDVLWSPRRWRHRGWDWVWMGRHTCLAKCLKKVCLVLCLKRSKLNKKKKHTSFCFHFLSVFPFCAVSLCGHDPWWCSHISHIILRKKEFSSTSQWGKCFSGGNVSSLCKS